MGHSELLTPTGSAIKELEFDVSFNTVHDVKVKLWPLKVTKDEINVPIALSAFRDKEIKYKK